MSDPDGIVRLPRSPSARTGSVFTAGEKVRIVSGPLRGFAALHSGLSTSQREQLLIEILGRTARVDVDPAVIVRQ
jgi:transcription antitermination factor NusG